MSMEGINCSIDPSSDGVFVYWSNDMYYADIDFDRDGGWSAVMKVRADKSKRVIRTSDESNIVDVLLEIRNFIRHP